MEEINATSTSDAGFQVTSSVDDWVVTVDASGREGPTPNQVLVADYVSCFIPAFRVSADEAGVRDLGRVEVEATATVDDEGDLAAIAFDLRVEASLGDQADAVLARSKEICHVHSALREGLHADVTVAHGVEELA